MENVRRSLVVLIVATLAASGCATGKGAFFSDAPVALVSIVSNYDINWKDEDPVSPSAVNSAYRRARRTDEDWVIVSSADMIIDEIEEIIRNTLEESPLVTLAPKDRALRSLSYNEARPNSVQEKNSMMTPEGYRLINNRDNNFYPALLAETGITRTLFITLDLTREMYSGVGKNGNCRAKVSMNVMLKDDRGKNLFHKTYDTYSRDTTRVTAGAYSQNEFLDLVLSAIEDACLDFLDNL